MNGLTWVGHSSVVIELDGVRLITDPVLGRRIAHLVRAEAVPQELLGGLDAVLVSHTHLDHLDFPSLRRIGRAVPVVVPTGARGMLRRRGFEHVVELAEGDEHRIGSLRVDATHAEHGVVRRYVRATSAALGFIVRGSLEQKTKMSGVDLHHFIHPGAKKFAVANVGGPWLFLPNVFNGGERFGE